MGKLTGKNKAFVTEYFTCNLNGTEAMRRVSPDAKRPDQLAYEYLRKPEVQQVIQERLAEFAMSGKEVIARLAEHARGTMADFLYIGVEEVILNRTITVQQKDDQELGPVLETIEEVETVQRPIARLDLQQAAERGKLHLVKKYTLSKDGAVSLELYDAKAALELIGKHQGLFKDDPLVNLNLTPEQLAELSDDELDALHSKLSSLTRRR